MKTACFIPIKHNSKRLPYKNIRDLGGKPLFSYILESVVKADCFDVVFIDTDSSWIKEFTNTMFPKIQIIDRDSDMLKKSVNGNHLLMHHFSKFPHFDYYFQVFCTSPFLSSNTIKQCVNILQHTDNKDSILTVSKESGWFWYKNKPINYDPLVLPRSQDADYIIKESTGLYGITKKSLVERQCRIGYNPIVFKINRIEAIDVDTEEDFKQCEQVLKND